MKIFCHVGPWCVKQYQTIAKGIDANAGVVIVSGFKSIDQSGLVSSYYENLREQVTLDCINEKYSEYKDIILRCRLLRVLDQKDAVSHLLAMKKAISNLFDREKPDLVISETIDQYLMDLIYFECKRRGVPFIGLLVSFVNGYYRISARGEFNKLREVSSAEVEEVIRKLEAKNYRPNFVQKSAKSTYTSALSRWSKNTFRIPYFTFKRYFSGERYNYHYWASQLSSINNFSFPPSVRIGSDDWRERIVSIRLPIIYLPLQMFPEATIDYWCECLDVIDYDNKLIEYIKMFNGDFQFIIKEHPNVIGSRNPNLYKRLSNLDNVSICPLYVDSNDLVNLSDAVMVWTGSVGFEAALRGKPVICVCKPFYASGKQFIKLRSNTDVEQIKSFIKNNSLPLDMIEKKDLVGNLLSGLLPGKYINDASWSPTNPDDIKDGMKIGNQIAVFLSSLE